MTAHVAAPPTAGVLRVAPEAGEAITTKFELATSSWASTELPLTYAFFAAADAGAGDTTVLKTGSLAAALVAALREARSPLRAWDAACAWAGAAFETRAPAPRRDRTARAPRRRATDSLGASGDAFAAATATAPTGGLNETVGFAWRRPPRSAARGPLPGRGRGGGLAGERNAAAPAARRRRGRRALRRAARRAGRRARHGRRVERRRRAVRRGAARARARDRGRGAAATGRGWRSARRGTCRSTCGRRRPAATRATAARATSRASSRTCWRRTCSRSARGGARRDGRGRGRRGRRRRHRDGARRGRCRRRGARGRRVGRPRHRRGEGVGERALDAGGAAAEYTSPDGPFVVALSALDGAGYHAAPVAAATLRFSRSAAAGDGRRRLANATFSGNVTLAVPAGDAREAAATGAVANATVYCPWNYVGPVYGTCPADNSTVEYACDRVGGEFRVLCGELLVDACVGWDGGAWDPGACAEDPERSTANATACVCALPEDGGARDYSTATTARSFAKAYLRNLVGPVDPEKSAVILGFLGVVVFASALAAICGHRLDKRDATLRRGRRLVLSHSSSFLLGASTRDLAKTLGDKRATHGGAPPLIHLPGSRPRTSPNDEEAASPADERGADLLAAGWRARRVRSLFRGAFRPKSSSRAQVAPLRRRVSAAAPADDGVAEGLQGSAAAGRADHRVGGADRHAHGGRGARDAAGVPGPEVRRAKVGPEMSKVHGGLQRPRALPVGRRERDLQRQPAAGRRLWRLFAPAGGALRHRDHAAVPEGVRVGRPRRPGADLALLRAPVARRRGCGRAGRARGAGGRRARGARRSLRSRVGRRLCSV